MKNIYIYIYIFLLNYFHYFISCFYFILTIVYFRKKDGYILNVGSENYNDNRFKGTFY